MNERQATESVLAWIERARRAQDLVGKVDLAKVVNHDREELGKLSRVTGALDDLSNGENVEFLPGVDVDEAPELSAEQIRRANLMEVLGTEGFGERLGRVFFTDGASGALRPLDLIPHREGLPEFLLCVAPEYAPMDGAQGVFISDRGVFAAMIPDPVSRHRWRVTRSRPYDDEREMVATLRHFVDRDSG